MTRRFLFTVTLIILVVGAISIALTATPYEIMDGLARMVRTDATLTANPFGYTYPSVWPR